MPHTDTIPVSASTVSTGTSIRYVGNWAYAYAGLFDSSTTEFEMLNFTTGSGLIVGKFILNGSVLFTADSHLGGNSAYKISLNDIAVSTLKIDTTGTDVGMPMTNEQPIIIPPFTKVVLSCVVGENSATEQVSAYFTGRVYGAE